MAVANFETAIQDSGLKKSRERECDELPKKWFFISRGWTTNQPLPIIATDLVEQQRLPV